MSRKLIINCDDLGPNPNVLTGLKKSLRDQTVRSASVIVNYGNLDDVAAFSQSHKEFGLGVHLNFTSGKPILPADKIPSIVDDNGVFLPRTALLKGVKVDPHEVENEFDAQIQQILKIGVTPTHLDNHHPEIYFFPELFQAAINLAKKYHLPLRVPYTPNFFSRIEGYATLYNCTREFLQQKAKQVLDRCNKAGLRYPDYFFVDFTVGDKSKKTMLDIISRICPGISEICVHIGSEESGLEKELAVIMDPEVLAIIGSKNIELVSYSVFNN